MSIDRIESVTTRSEQDRLYQEAAAQFGPALDRLALAYEADANVREDLLQDIHLAIWRSFAGFDGRCSIRTWVYRVAHNTAASHVVRRTRLNRKAFLTLCEIERLPDCQPLGSDVAARQQTLDARFRDDPPTRPARSPNHRGLPGGYGRSRHWGNDWPFVRRCCHKGLSHQEHSRSPFSARSIAHNNVQRNPIPLATPGTAAQADGAERIPSARRPGAFAGPPA